MQTANDLLNNASLINSENEGHIVIGVDRRIVVPAELNRIAVQYDHNIETVTFDCPRYWDNIDMSTMRVYINYKRSDGYLDSYPVKTITVDDVDQNVMHFDWTISRNVTSVYGGVSFLVCITNIDLEGNEVNHWNSELCTTLFVSPGMEAHEMPEEERKDLVAQLIAIATENMTGQQTEAGGEIFNDYEKNNAINKYSHTEGSNNISGVKGFLINNIELPKDPPFTATADDPATITVFLDSLVGLAIDDSVSIKMYSSAGWVRYLTDIGRVASINNEANSVEVAITENRTIEYSFAEQTDKNNPEQLSYLWVASKPAIGTHIWAIAQHAEGINTHAFETAAHAEGEGTKVYSPNGHAEGKNTLADYNCHAEGRDTKAYGEQCHVEGSGSQAIGYNNHAEGISTTALGQGSHAEGIRAKTNGLGSHAEGQETTAEAFAAHSEGYATVASGQYSHAEGGAAKATGSSSHAEGSHTKAVGGSSHAEGSYTEANGSSSHVEGYVSRALGDYSHAEGNSARAGGKGSHAEGNGTHSDGEYAHAEGNVTYASGNNAHAEGLRSTASGENSHAEGNNTKASNLGAHAEGFETEASGKYAHAEGSGSKAVGDYSHAEGYKTTANGAWSHAEGSGTTASTSYARAGGLNSTAGYVGDFVHGNGLRTEWGSGDNQKYRAVFGRYNKYEPNGILTIGNGTAEKRENAFVVFNDGHAEVQSIGESDNSVVLKQELNAALKLIEDLTARIAALENK